MRRYSDPEVLRLAASEVLKRIRDDRRRAPQSLKKLFTVIARDLFKTKLKAQYAWEQAGIKDHAQTEVFKQLVGVSLKQYINKRRIQVAKLLIATTDLNLTTISMMLGYDHHVTFSENFKKLNDGQSASKVPRLSSEGPTFDDVMAIRFFRGELEADEAKGAMQKVHGHYPRVVADLQKPAPTSNRPLIIVKGERNCRLVAGGLWLEIRDLPFEEQKEQVRRYLFHTPALFDLLRKKSRQRGRQNRQHGVELAELALVSLEVSDEVFEDRIHDLRALGWAWLGNAYRLAVDFSEADRAFEEADREWSAPRAERDQVVLAGLCDLKGTLRMYQRDYVTAEQLLDHSCSFYRAQGDVRAEVSAVMQRAAVHGYSGRLTDSLEDLQTAVALVDEESQGDLAFGVRANLANTLARAERPAAAAKELMRARHLYSQTQDPTGVHKLAWIEGSIQERRGEFAEAERLYTQAQVGFGDAGESRYFALVAVDRMVISAKQRCGDSLLELAVEGLPILQSLKLHSETVAAVGLLAQAVESETVSERVLKELQELLRQDPLAQS